MGTSRLRFGPSPKRERLSGLVFAQASSDRYVVPHVQVSDKRSMGDIDSIGRG
jgi:hypothetical protein